MLKEYIDLLCKELSIEMPKLNEEKWFPFQLNDGIQVDLKDLEPGVAMQASLCLSPQKNREDLYIYLMRANMLGQGTGGCRIGIDEKEKSLTLSLGLPYEMNYTVFKESIEDFVNYLVYWREEIAKFEKEKCI